MRKYFRSLADVLASPIVAAVNALRRDKAARQDRVLQSTKLEDMIYQGLHKGDDELIALEQSCTEKLSTFSALSRDIYQSFYSLRVRKREEESLSAPSRRFNVPILKELMDGDSYPTIKAACEGRQIPAYEAAGEFISQVADNLDSLMEQAGGQKNALETLEHLEEKRDQSMERLQKLIEQMEQSHQGGEHRAKPEQSGGGRGPHSPGKPAEARRRAYPACKTGFRGGRADGHRRTAHIDVLGHGAG